MKHKISTVAGAATLSAFITSRHMFRVPKSCSHLMYRHDLSEDN